MIQNEFFRYRFATLKHQVHQKKLRELCVKKIRSLSNSNTSGSPTLPSVLLRGSFKCNTFIFYHLEA